MYKYYLSIGSNVGNIVKNLDKAIEFIKKQDNVEIKKVAPYYFTPPLLPKNANESYYKIYCNTCIEIETIIEPKNLLFILKDIEHKIGRKSNYKIWSPRIIDIDILYCEKNGKFFKVSIDKIECDKNNFLFRNKNVKNNLIIPHREIFNRSFVLDPLSYLNSNLKINNKSVLCEAKNKKHHQSIIMGIVNLTDNSFSGDGILDKNKIEKKIKTLARKTISIIDIGCEATNKKSKKIDVKEENERLQNVFDLIKDIKKNTYSIKFSIDTYNPETAENAIKNGFDIINDVNGFKNEKMWKLMQKYNNVEAIIMHSLTPHSKSDIVYNDDIDIIKQLNHWVEDIKTKAKEYNIDENRIIIDYGIGFGKTSFQSLTILQNIEKIDSQNFRVLIGHSNKSFMSLFTKASVKNRMFETIGGAISLQQKGVDIIRVHKAIELQKTMFGYMNTT